MFWVGGGGVTKISSRKSDPQVTDLVLEEHEKEGLCLC